MSQRIVDKLKREADELQAEANKAQGALESSTARLKEDFGCANLKEARQYLKKLEDEESECQAKFDKALEKYEEEWNEKL